MSIINHVIVFEAIHIKNILIVHFKIVKTEYWKFQ